MGLIGAQGGVVSHAGDFLPPTEGVTPTFPAASREDYSGEYAWYEAMSYHPEHWAVRVPVEEIDLLASKGLRKALHQQVEDKRAKSKFVTVTRVNPDGSQRIPIRVHREPLRLPDPLDE